MKNFFPYVLIILASCGPVGSSGNETPPNIILILGDDVGWTDLACMGSGYYETPHLDRLAREGMKFTEAYASSCQCAPTRACLITGRDIGRHGLYAVDRIRGLEKFRKMIPPPNNRPLSLDQPSLGSAMKNAGYRTAMFGKWHLGLKGAHHPSARGFDEAITFGDRYEYYGFTPDAGEKPPEGTYLTDYLGALAVRFIRRNKARPFFLYLPHFAVHGPHVPKKGKAEKYRGKPPSGGHRVPKFAAMIESLDDSVGAILGALDDLDLTRTTAVFFTSDNGGLGGYRAEGLRMGDSTSNLPLRGGKGMMFEGGIRVPLLARWPGVVQPGSVCGTPVITTDFFPTFLEIAGTRAKRKDALDGVSILPLLRQEALRREAIFWHYPSYLQAEVEKGTWRITPSSAIRSGKYKLIEYFESHRLVLYDLSRDIGERTDLSDRLPEKARSLHRRLAAWRRETGAPMPAAKTR